VDHLRLNTDAAILDWVATLPLDPGAPGTTVSAAPLFPGTTMPVPEAPPAPAPGPGAVPTRTMR